MINPDIPDCDARHSDLGHRQSGHLVNINYIML
jgi:hypothetical protein